MKRRCKPNWYKHHLYFDRGISVCAEWEHDFQAFLSAVGPKPAPDFQLDRVKNNRGYEPGNVRWVDRLTQRHNQRVRDSYPRNVWEH